MDPIEIFSPDLTFANLAAVAAIELPGRSCDNLSVTFDSCRGLGTQELLGDDPAATLLKPTQMWGPGRIAANEAELSPTLPFSLPSGQLRRDSEEISSAVKATAIKATSVNTAAVKDATDLFTAIHACNVGTDVLVLRKVLERCRKRVYDVKSKRANDPELSSLAAQRSRLKDLVRNKTTAVVVDDQVGLASAEVAAAEEIAQATIASEAPGPAEVIAKKVVQEMAKAPDPAEDLPVNATIEQTLEVVLGTSAPPLLEPKVKPKPKAKGRLRQKTLPPAVEVSGVKEAAGIEKATVKPPTWNRLQAS